MTSPSDPALETAARWHDEQECAFRAAADRVGELDDKSAPLGAALMNQKADWHRDCAISLRALQSAPAGEPVAWTDDDWHNIDTLVDLIGFGRTHVTLKKAVAVLNERYTRPAPPSFDNSDGGKDA